MNELELNNNLYVLYGEIPENKLCIIDSLINCRDNDEELGKDLRSRFYSMSKCGENSFIVSSVTDTMDSSDSYYFGYDNSDEDFSKSFMSLTGYLRNARFIGRVFVPNKEYAYESFNGSAISSLEVESIENDETSYELVCVLGNIAIIKQPSFITSGYKLVPITETPLVGKKYDFTKGEVKTYNVDEIINGIISDINDEVLGNINIDSGLGIDDSVIFHK